MRTEPLAANNNSDLANEMERVAAAVDRQFDTLLQVPDDPRRELYEAMRHAAIGGGKRLRPLLVMATAGLFNVDESCAIRAATAGEALFITLAVAGFSRGELSVTVENNELVIRGRQRDEEGRTYLHRGIAARQFQRAFVLADGMEVTGAVLENGLLKVDLARPEPQKTVRRIEIVEEAPETDRRPQRETRRAEATE